MACHRALSAPLVWLGVCAAGCANTSERGGPSSIDSVSPDAASPDGPAPAAVDAATPAPEPSPSPADAAPPTGGESDTAPAPVNPGGATADDEAPERPLNVDKTNPQTYTFKFKPSDADPMAASRDETQTAVFNSGAAKIQGKLMVTLSGVNNPPGPVGVATYGAALGYHAYTVAYQNGFNPSTQNDPNFFGNARYEAFDGMDRTKAITVNRPDCVEVRVAKALAYLQTKNPAGDWAYYLKKDGTVRWSDVIFIGHSHGASSAAAYAKVRRIWRAISLSGPRDTNPVTATWLSQPSLTPIERYYGFTGTGDAQHQDHLKAMQAAGYLGEVVDVEKTPPPFNNSHKLQYAGGHGGSAECHHYDAVCKYMLGAQ